MLPLVFGVALTTLILATPVVVALRWPLIPAQAPVTTVSAVTMGELRSVDVTPEPGIGLGAFDVQTINSLIKESPELRNDVLFLVIATARDHCFPRDAGSLARMANRAQLPVLAGVSVATAERPTLERPLYRYIQTAATAVDCHRQLTLAGQHAISISAYAEAFPDSFYLPTRAKPPSEYGVLSLSQRAAQPCRSIAYAVLPLGVPQWQCDSSRAGARKRIVALCESEQERRGLAHEVELSPSIGESLSPGVAAVVGNLPVGCR